MPPTLLLLHGFTHTGASWEGVLAELGQRYRPLAPDIRGHGAAGAVRPVTLAPVLEDVAAATDGPFALGGYSMGGRLALHVALALGGRVRRLVLIGASPGLADPEERTARRAADERLAGELEGLTIEAAARRWARTAVLADQPPDVRAAVHADRLRSTPAGLAAALRGLGTGALPSLWGRLGELTLPVALIVGERDEKFLEVAERMAQRLPDARLAVVPGCGHAVHLEAPEAVARIIDTSPAARLRVPGRAAP
ncbi:MAG: alpha/beta fold hydrolase [Solirubrobacterales bacterium]|nr:alpha/beta fold hydrolase [Solirubrobacterales bacterium]